MAMNEAFQVTIIIKKLSLAWENFKSYLKHKKNGMGIGVRMNEIHFMVRIFVRKGFVLVIEKLDKHNVINVKAIKIWIKASILCYLLEFSKWWLGRLWYVNYDSLRRRINLIHIPTINFYLMCETCVEINYWTYYSKYLKGIMNLWT